MSECMYPQNAACTGYSKGCRCSRCVDAKRETRKKYNHSQKGKLTQKRYLESEKGITTRYKYKERRKIVNTIYEKSEIGKQSKRRYLQSEKGKITRQRYLQSEKGLSFLRHKSARRRARMKCPLSLDDKQKIISIYAECHRITEETGIVHHVDHIIPLSKGGLHHPSNLQILTATENLKKGNKTTPMPEHGG